MGQGGPGPGLGEGPAPQAEVGAQRLVAGEAHEGPSEVLRVLGAHEQAAAGGLDDFGECRQVARDDGAPHGHRLDRLERRDSARDVHITARHGEDVERLVPQPGGAPGDPPREHDVLGEAEPLHLVDECGPGDPVADDGATDVRSGCAG